MDKIVKLAKMGNKRAIEFLIKKYELYIFKESNKVKLRDYSKEDLIQIGKLSVLKAINKYNLNQGSNFTAYVIQSIKNNFYNKIRRESKNRFDISLYKENAEGSKIIDTIASNFNLEQYIMKREQKDKLNKALSKLSKEDRKLINWVYYDEKKLTDYAKINNLSYNFCVKRKKKILQILKKHMYYN
ncbi:RNA polymerase sigma factor FliA [Clostridium acetireducens DSM 10703]|uniref:RNA polymerase sigma factor FliA n=1 Tax=Clostridium acetireducens DSM 10703 TaxID=1121290 RepID=A0A1E8EZE0_9CLOT|nr:sigma-70 family RNA polymerase sigma factor [Clostridium acetireducens]OFI06499.1 RNA polymerase sigma factor FliA [Clostridium acetireducens DSM 10703]